MGALPEVSVVVPTIGRPKLLSACLDSLARCDPGPTEVVVVDQSGEAGTRDVVASFVSIGARVVTCHGRGRGHAVNHGLHGARYDLILMTDDDCTVAADWVRVGATSMERDPSAIVTGRVLPAGDAEWVPSTIDDPIAHDYTGAVHYGYLHAGNMACSRAELLAFGGFDERIVPSAEDNDLCYRWLRAGRSMRYEPELVVWHHDWRTEQQLEELYVRDARGQGVFYAKQLRQRDLRVLRFLAVDVLRGVRGAAARFLRGRPRWSDGRQGLLRGLPGGLRAGWGATGGRAAQPSASDCTPGASGVSG